jgi:Zn-dependent protease
MFSGLSFAQILIVLASILFSMAVHEAMHAYIAHWLGDTTAQDMGRLTLNPLKHIDLFTTILLPMLLILFNAPPFFAAKPVPFDPSRVKFGEYGAALVGIAGPITNFALAVIVALLIRIFGADMGMGTLNALVIFIEVNIAFFVFNMIPFPPLDGSRLLYAFAPEPLQRIMYQIESMGFLSIIFFFLIVFQFVGTGVITIEDKIVQLLLG